MPKRSRKITKKKTSKQTVFTRYMLVVAVFIFWIGAIGVRLVHLQVNQHEWLRERALEQRSYEHKSKMLRGTIFDRNERALAMSIKVNSLYADPTEIEDVDAAARELAGILKISKKEIAADLKEGKEKNRRFVWIARKLDEEKYEEVNKILTAAKNAGKTDEKTAEKTGEETNGKTVENPAKENKEENKPKLKGLYWREEQKRSYPYKNLAAHIIGFTNSEHLGLAGVEMSQEEILKGEIISRLRERDRLGRVYDEEEPVEREPPKDVVLTLSSSIQFKTEEALAKGVKNSRSKSGKAIVLDPKTGEILAMANFPSYDPNEFQKLDPSEFKNKVIQDNYSPGSVFKLITYGAALEENLIAPEQTIDCGGGTITVGGHTFKDSHAVGNVSYTTAFAHSSNVGAIKTGMAVGKERFYKYARKFGFGEKTGIQLPAEAGGILRSPERWNGDSLASMSIGYEIGVTALQSAAAFATIANDGVRVQPHIIKEIRQSNGKIVSTNNPEKERIVSAETARDLRLMLREVVLEGTAKTAQLVGYTSAGKTGTAWKYDPKIKAVNRNKYVSSFIGFAPADDPRVVIAVIMDEPQGALRNGGQVAGPVFREIAEQVLPELNVKPDGTMPRDFSIDDESFDEIQDENPVETLAAENQGESSNEKATEKKSARTRSDEDAGRDGKDGGKSEGGGGAPAPGRKEKSMVDSRQRKSEGRERKEKFET